MFQIAILRIICTDSSEIFFTKLRSFGLNNQLPKLSFFHYPNCVGVCMLIDSSHFCSNGFKFYTDFLSVTLCYHKVQQSHIQNMACPMYSNVFAFFTSSNNLSTVMTTKMAQNGRRSPVKQSIYSRINSY